MADEMKLSVKMEVDSTQAQADIKKVADGAKQVGEEADKAADKAKKITEETKKMGEEIKKAFDASPMQSFQSSIGSVNGKIQSLFSTFTKFSVMAAGGFGMTALVQGAVNAGDTLYKLSSRFGMTTAEASKFSKITGQTGSDAVSAIRTLSRLDNTISGTGTSAKTAKNVLEAVGVSLTDSQGRLKSYSEQLSELAKGFSKAEEAGLEQEFVLNTLGMKGMMLIGTLREYKTVSEQIAQVKGVGLNANDMHELNETIKQINMQLGGLKLASGVALAPLAKEVLENVLPLLRQMAEWFSKNREEITEITKLVAELVVSYEALKLGMNAVKSIQAFKDHIEQAVEAASKVATASAEEVATTNSANARMSASTKTAYTEMTGASTAFSAKAKAEMTAIAEQATISANTVKTQYITAFNQAGNAAVVSAEKVTALSTATAMAGNQATAMGAKTAIACVSASTKVATLAKAVFSLAGGWVSVAVAIGTAAIEMYNFVEEEKKRAKNDPVYEYNGKRYQYDEKNRTMVWLDKDNGRRNVWDATENNNAFEAAKSQGLKVDENYKVIKDQTDATKKSTEEMERLKKSQQEMVEQLQKALGMGGGEDGTTASTKSASGSSTPKKNNTQQAGESDAMFAMRFLMANGYTKEQSAGLVGNFMQESGGGTQTFDIGARDGTGAVGLAQWMGDRLENLRAFQRDNYGGQDTLESQLAFVVKELQSKEVLANNEIKATSNARDAAYNVDKYYERSAGTERGKRQDYAQEVYDQFNGQFGEYDASGVKGVLDRTKQIENAKKQLQDLEKSLTSSTSEMYSTDYENKMAKLSDEIDKKKKEIENIKNVSDEIDTSKAEELLETYKNAKIDEINKAWESSLNSVKQKIAQTTAEATGDYKTLADIQYENTVKQAEKEEEEQIKKLSRYQGDVEAQKVAEDEKTAKVMQAVKEREQTIRESFARTASLRVDEGDGEGLKSLLSSGQGKDYMDWQGQKDKLNEYYELWKQSHQSMDEMIANTAKTLQSGLNTFFQNIFNNTESFVDSIYTLITSVFNSLLSELTSKWSSSIVSNILGGLSGDKKSSKSSSSGSSTSNLKNNLTSDFTQNWMQKGMSKVTSSIGGLFGNSKSGNKKDPYGLNSFSKQLKTATSDTKNLTKAVTQGTTGISSLTDTTDLLTEATSTEESVSTILGTTAKPTEETASTTLSTALTELTTAAYSAAAALASIKAGGGIFGGYATGGAISGIGTSTSDSIPAMLSDGEFVLRAEAVNRIGIPTLNAMNEGRMKHFSAGGAVSSINAVGAVGSPMSINISAMDGNSVRSFLRNGGLKEIKQALFSDTRNFASKAGVW
jgi:hypothetical protein